MKQRTLAMMTGFEQYTRKTRRAIFLEEMEQVVPWGELCALVAPHYPLPRLGIMRRHQRAQLAPRHHLLHLLQKYGSPRLPRVLLKAAHHRQGPLFHFSDTLASPAVESRELNPSLPSMQRLSPGSLFNRNPSQQSEVAENLTRAEHHAAQRVIGDTYRQPGFFPDSL